MVNSFSSRPEILWRQVWGLATLLAAIIFSWMAYGLFQPKILQKLEFSELAGSLGIIQGLLSIVIEPVVGGLSDRIQHYLGNRLPLISVGVTLAGLIFVAVSLLVEQNLQGAVRWVVPVLMTAWVVAMIIFRGPAIALLMQFAPVTELPQANAILVFVFGLVGAIGPILDILLNKIGASMTFLLGAIALIMGAYILRSSTPNHSFNPSTINQDIPATTPPILLILIFCVGFGAGLEVNLLMSIFPLELQTQLPSIKLEFITSGIFLVSAIASIPLGEWTAQLGANKAITLGLGTMTGLMGLALLNDNDILVVAFILAFGISFSLVFVSMIPFALSKVPPNQAGLSTGLYFGGSAGATALVPILIKQVGMTSMGAFLLAEVAFFAIAGCIMMSKKIQLA
ncbi:MFS transporter [Calothrix sp. PCC 7507]|uniref:MFS transporter n=1 Tax=Calothrix sp. PCC 7507 TaxID=99598 RepID=UPI00029F253E|nr:MFS transporter [Calothrix sp. PCC 7507]AFY31419.1 major facilitator superfamily MFS_1 [Calothrix sp. PCC 7507]